MLSLFSPHLERKRVVDLRSPVQIIKKRPDDHINGNRCYISLPRTGFSDPLRTPIISTIIFWNLGLPSGAVTVDGKTWRYGMSYGEPRVSDPLLALCRVREDPKVVDVFDFMLLYFASLHRDVCCHFFLCYCVDWCFFLLPALWHIRIQSVLGIYCKYFWLPHVYKPTFRRNQMLSFRYCINFQQFGFSLQQGITNLCDSYPAQIQAEINRYISSGDPMTTVRQQINQPNSML